MSNTQIISSIQVVRALATSVRAPLNTIACDKLDEEGTRKTIKYEASRPVTVNISKEKQ